MIAEGDRVAARFTMRGTHRSLFFGASANRQANEGASDELLHCVGRPIRGRTRAARFATLLQQIGALPR